MKAYAYGHNIDTIAYFSHIFKGDCEEHMPGTIGFYPMIGERFSATLRDDGTAWINDDMAANDRDGGYARMGYCSFYDIPVLSGIDDY